MSETTIIVCPDCGTEYDPQDYWCCPSERCRTPATVLDYIQVYFNAGEAATPWHVGLHDGVSVTEIFGTFRESADAIRLAIRIATEKGLLARWPAWLKGEKYVLCSG